MSINRRGVVIGLGYSASAFMLSCDPTQAGWLGNAFRDVRGYFPEAARVLSGWTVIDIIYGTNQDIHSAGDLIQHVDAMLPQISSTLKTIQTFVQDCDDALHDIEGALKRLPGQIGDAFDAVEASKELGNLRGQSANMSAYLTSRGSIHTNASRIQDLCENIVQSISILAELQTNPFQFTMQTVPALTTWVQGYTAYNALQKPENRSINPWDHQIISAIALPKILDSIKQLQSEQAWVSKIEPQLAAKTGVVYRYDVAKKEFSQTSIPFKWIYQTGEIDDGLYYCACPNALLSSYPTALFKLITSFRPGPIVLRIGPYGDPLDLAYLVQDKEALGFRYWAGYPNILENGVSQWLANAPKAADARAFDAMSRAAIDPRHADYERVTNFYEVAYGLGQFDDAVKKQLIEGSRDKWLKLPILPS